MKEWFLTCLRTVKLSSHNWSAVKGETQNLFLMQVLHKSFILDIIMEKITKTIFLPGLLHRNQISKYPRFHENHLKKVKKCFEFTSVHWVSVKKLPKITLKVFELCLFTGLSLCWVTFNLVLHTHIKHGEFYQQQAISPAASREHEACSAVTVFTGYGCQWESYCI